MGYQNLLRDLARVQERMQTAQSQVSSGKKVRTPSDNPAAASDIIRLTSEKSETEQYARNLTFAKSKLEVTDTVLDSVERMVERVRTLGQMSFSDPAAAAPYAIEIRGLRDQIVSAANTTFAGRFIFAGSATTTAPFTKDEDSTVTYAGNAEDMTVQISRTSTLSTQLSGNDVFSGTVDIFETISNLVTAIEAEDKPGIDEGLRALEQFSELLSVNRSKIGGYINIATAVESELTSANIARESELSEEQAADLAKAITELTMSQNALQATLAVGARISQLSLLDYL